MFFVIGFVGRVGSSHLEGLLNSHPEVQCRGEILSRMQLENSRETCRERLDRLVHSSPKTASGFKLPWRTFRPIRISPIYCATANTA